MRIYFSALFFSVFATFIGFNAAAQKITRVAVLDYALVFQKIPNQSGEQQYIDELKTQAQNEMADLKEQLMQLQEELNQAEAENRNGQARRLQNEMKKLREYGRKYLASKNQEIARLKKQATQNESSNNHTKQILADVISQVAREQGYSIIMTKNSPNIIWQDTTIDITQAVIQRLEKRLETSQ